MLLIFIDSLEMIPKAIKSYAKKKQYVNFIICNTSKLYNLVENKQGFMNTIKYYFLFSNAHKHNGLMIINLYNLSVYPHLIDYN